MTIKTGDTVFCGGHKDEPRKVLYADKVGALIVSGENTRLFFSFETLHRHGYTTFPTDLTDKSGRVIKVGDRVEWNTHAFTILEGIQRHGGDYGVTARCEDDDLVGGEVGLAFEMFNEVSIQPLIKHPLNLSYVRGVSDETCCLPEGFRNTRDLVRHAIFVERECGINLDA